MKKFLGITLGGLHSKILAVLLIFLLAIVGFNTTVSIYKTSTLSKIVDESGKEQREAIEKVSGETMHKTIENSLKQINALRADKLDDEFTEIENNILLLRNMAKYYFENADKLEPVSVPLPDPNNVDDLEVHLLYEEGVDYSRSEYVGIAGHLVDAMTAMVQTNDTIGSCYIGLADGTHIGVANGGADKYDENGKQKPYPVRHRPWYVGAVEKGDIFFTGVERDAFNGSLSVTCAAPVIVNGKTVAVVGSDIVFDDIDEFVTEANSNAEFIFVVNNNGQIVAVPENNGIFKIEDSETAEDLRTSDNKQLADFITRALTEQTGLETVTLNDKEYYLSSAPMKTVGWAVVSVVDKEMTQMSTDQLLTEIKRINTDSADKFRDGMSKLSMMSVVIIVLIIIVGSISALIVANRIVKPITAMTDNLTGKDGNGTFEMKDLYRTGDEIQVLAESFDKLSKDTVKYIENITEITKEKERIGTELSLATQIQVGMLPHIFPPFPHRHEIDIYAVMEPAREVGGDFYDFFLVDEDHLGLVMADVSGKGVPAALFMMISKALLKSNAMLGQSPAEVLMKVNNLICANNQAEMFVTVWLGIFEISTGKLTAANAGHEYPALKRADGSFELYKDKHGFVIGGMEDVRYKEYTIDMKKGDKLFLYTDGVPEATDSQEQMFGTDRMLEALNIDNKADPEQLLKNVRNAVNGFVKEAEQFDDLTMMCLEYKGSEPLESKQEK
ncbi:sigma-B regulation protein RsbU (phosphoserine phosphatase) [Ruminococcus sp. YRD2003]|uniref:SpoIIE family protein phosphatase n=1 Tax=Ruminococcus sp. YRD2003 TaxID=1452313 RepID=UPI0008C01FE4|nr:sigma-B regulation protein RsbU (phosphoserine phosphatase) [Ruminococcus flavefaciens]